jgi:hypothetical protein
MNWNCSVTGGTTALPTQKYVREMFVAGWAK